MASHQETQIGPAPRRLGKQPQRRCDRHEAFEHRQHRPDWPLRWFGVHHVGERRQPQSAAIHQQAVGIVTERHQQLTSRRPRGYHPIGHRPRSVFVRWKGVLQMRPQDRTMKVSRYRTRRNRRLRCLIVRPLPAVVFVHVNQPCLRLPSQQPIHSAADQDTVEDRAAFKPDIGANQRPCVAAPRKG